MFKHILLLFRRGAKPALVANSSIIAPGRVTAPSLRKNTAYLGLTGCLFVWYGAFTNSSTGCSMRTTTSVIDASILPAQARQELQDFYNFLIGKYVTSHAQPSTKTLSPAGTAGALAASPLVGIWKDRDLGDSSVFARSLREQAQKRKLS